MRAANMQALTNDIKAKYPGVTIYGIGDDAHKTRISDHNEDDTPGVRAEQSDSDNIPEHRAIDVMLGNALSRDQARALVQSFLDDSPVWVRLHYIIFEGSIYTKRPGGWVRSDHTDDPHNDHVHFSGDASDDENSSSWSPLHPSTPPPASGAKSLSELADEVQRGDWGNGSDRRNNLTAAGYNYDAVQAEVTRRLGTTSDANVGLIQKLAMEVIRGDWGNGVNRERRLKEKGYDYEAVRAEVNRQLGVTTPARKTVPQLALEVIRGEWGNGTDRKNRLTAAGYDYEAVRAEVNRRV